MTHKDGYTTLADALKKLAGTQNELLFDIKKRLLERYKSDQIPEEEDTNRRTASSGRA